MNKDWIKVENFISEDICTLLYGHILLAHKRCLVTKDKGMELLVTSRVWVTLVCTEI